ncbi:MAG: hypothetical protein HC828_09580 [Blastochloris sp.]|nr:hypothetical protein [Blastochloris sp.]
MQRGPTYDVRLAMHTIAPIAVTPAITALFDPQRPTMLRRSQSSPASWPAPS